MTKTKLNILDYIAYIIMLVLVVPYFLGIAFADSPQLRDSLFTLIFCTLIIAVKSEIKLQKPMPSKQATVILAAAYLSLFLYSYSIFFALGALVLTLTSLALLFLEKKNFKLAYAFGGGFYSYCIMLVLSQLADFPLRLAAGLGASKFLNFINTKNKLLIIKQEGAPIILRCQNEGDFLVATQCNGFSIIASSFVLSLFLAIFSKSNILKRAIYVLASIAFAYITNTLRICTIVKLSPIVGEEKYFLMHEITGYSFSLLTLSLIYLFARKLKI